MFPPTSRYAGIEAAEDVTPNGRKVVYLRRRFVPAASGVAMAEHTVTERERLDNISARYLGDPEQFWRLCDANNAMRPDDITAEVGLRLIIPLPQAGV